ATIYMIPDGPMPDGQYHFWFIAADEVRWGSYMDYIFEIDLTPPDTPVNIDIDPETYIDPVLGDLYLKAGETCNLSVTAPSSLDDASMSRVVFQQAVAGYEGAAWEDIGNDSNVMDNYYSVTWKPDPEYYYLRAIAYDYVGNYAISEQFTDFHVDGAGPLAPLALQVTLNLENAPKARVSGFVYDRIVEGQTSGVDCVVLYVNGEPLTDNGEVVHVPVIDLAFAYDIELLAINSTTGDISYLITAQAYDHVGNAGDLTDAIWTNTGYPDPMRIISPATINYILMKEEISNPDDSLDEIRSIIVTFLDTEQDPMNYPFIIRPGQLRTSSDAAGIGLRKNTKFLYGYYTVEVPPQMTNFVAQVTIEFHLNLDPKSLLGPSTKEILENIRLIARYSGENTWEMLDLVRNKPQIVDPWNNIWRVTTRMNRFSDFALIIAQTDLTVKDIALSDHQVMTGQNVSITITVHNGGDFPKDAHYVKVMVYSIDPDGNYWPIGELDYGTIDPEVDYYPDEPALGMGDKKATLYWEAPDWLDIGEKQIFTIKAVVDPEGYVREINETNNMNTATVKVVGTAIPPTLTISHWLNNSEVKGKVTIYGTAWDNTEVRRVEYRFVGTDEWLQANGTTNWFVWLDTTKLKDGTHTLEFRAYDGKYYSEVDSITLKVKNEEKENPGPFGLVILLTILSILFGTLIIVVRSPDEYYKRSLPIKQPENEEIKERPSKPSQPPQNIHTCEHCGTRFEHRTRERSIWITCPHCGKESVRGEFR
ncbi:MAG: hypothetical protein KAU14_03225, partial [Thermoplasmata archaeon]|nr:hypothetical protein [Thermoplasmata archaeon]